MLGVQRVLNKKDTDEVPTVNVLMAATALNTGDPLDDLNTKFVAVNQDACPEGVVTDLEQIQERSLKVPASPGDWILLSKLTEPGEIGAVANIPPGMRVATIPVDATKSHSGMLRPGNRVDVLLTRQDVDQTGKRRQKVQTILQYIEVFAVDDKVYGTDKDGGGSAKNISLLVKPDQASRLELAEKLGDLSTTLRSTGDTDEISVVDMSDDVFGKATAAEINNVSTLDARRDPEQQGFRLPLEEEPTSVMAQLQSEFDPDQFGSGSQPFASGPMTQQPVPPPQRNIWKIAIHEGGKVRVEEIDLDSDEPIDTSDPASPADPDTVSTDITLDEILDEDSSTDFEKTASGLLDLFKGF